MGCGAAVASKYERLPPEEDVALALQPRVQITESGDLLERTRSGHVRRDTIDLVEFLGRHFQQEVPEEAFADLVLPLVRPLVGPFLSEESLDALLRAVFRDLDDNGSGGVTRDELLWFVVNRSQGPAELTVPVFAALIARCVLDRAPPRASAPSSVATAVLDLFYGSDTNEDGMLDESEFVAAMVSHIGAASDAAIATVFREVDSDANGLVDITEFYAWLEEHAQQGSGTEVAWTQETIHQILRASLNRKDLTVQCCICLCEDPMHSLAPLHPERSSCQTFAHEDCLRLGIHTDGFAKCPHCREIADIVQFKRLLSPAEQALYLKRTLDEYESTHRSLIFHCPTPNCDNFVLLPCPIEAKDRDRPRKENGWQCRRCGHAWCMACGQRRYGLHSGLSCNQRVEVCEARQRDPDAQSDDALLLNCKCGVQILKYGGCKFVTCENPSCNLNWCWVCRAGPSKTKHFDHRCLIAAYFGRHTKPRHVVGGDTEVEHPIDTIEEVVEEIVKYQRRDKGKSVADVKQILTKFAQGRGLNVRLLRHYFTRFLDKEVLECLPDGDDFKKG
mmetsp:Transcript_9577/g.25027  ORF Transcript_9577/g.25027 Transcript_9577/m.25027 type:complete len:561 (+) Transcript_9577:116-1798(+)